MPERLPDDRYAPRQQIVDLLLRGLHGWRAGLPSLAIPAPWGVDRAGTVAPHPTFVAWRALADRLRDRRFVGELPVAALAEEIGADLSSLREQRTSRYNIIEEYVDQFWGALASP